MRYMMKKALFSLGDDFYIKDKNGQDRFFVDGKAFSIGNQLSFQDLSGKELCYISQVVLSLGQNYEIYKDGALWATVEKELFTFFKCRFDIEEAGATPLETEGDFLDHDYVFTRGGNPVAQVSMEFFTVADTYGVEIADGEEDVLILAATVVIDMACHHNSD
jgi:uncharacterized protein YxjI